VIIDLDQPALPARDRSRRAVDVALRRRLGPRPAAPAGHAHWDAAFFGLDRSRAFRAAGAAAQAAVLERLGRGLLAEAVVIETCGVSYAGKMLLLAESTSERQLYALIAADEATHLGALEPFAPGAAAGWQDNPFLALLVNLIEEGDRASLQLVVQVVLEGWGLTHYRALRDGCGDPDLAAALDAILVDEASHHGSGVALLAAGGLPATSRPYVSEVLHRFLAMVQVGPAAVVAAMDAEVGLTAAARRQLLEDLAAERHAAERLGKLRALLHKVPAAVGLAAELEARGRFRPLPIDTLAEALAA
jgi:hypothetical protein